VLHKTSGDAHGQTLQQGGYGVAADPFYTEANQARIREATADARAGRNMAVHELIED
jgi:hypothetical protein